MKLYDRADLGVYRGGNFNEDFLKNQDSDGGASIKSVINLERGYFEFFHGRVNKEAEWCIANEILPIHIPLSNVRAPSLEELCMIVRLIYDLQQRGSVYVHCFHGVDRTGMVIAAWRIIKENWSANRAIQEMYRKGFHRFPYDALGWPKRLHELALFMHNGKLE